MSAPFRRFCGVLVILAGLSLGVSGAVFPHFWVTELGLLSQAMMTHHGQLGESIILQALTCLCLIIAVVGLQSDPRATRSKTMRVGAVLLLIGTLGLAIQAWFEWVVFCQSFPVGEPPYFGLISPLMLKPTRLVLPLLLGIFFLGSTVYSAGFYHIDATGVWPKRLCLMGLAWGIAGHYLAPSTQQPLVYHGFLLWFTIAYCWLGFEICFRFRPSRPKALAPAGREHLFD